MKTLWRDDEPQHNGRFSQFSDLAFSPRRVRPEGIPLLIGGTSRAAIRWAARHGDGWHPTAMPPEDLAQGIRYLGEQAEPAGRDPDAIPVSVSIPLQGGRPGRFTLGADPAEMRANAPAFAHIGVSRLVYPPTPATRQKYSPPWQPSPQK